MWYLPCRLSNNKVIGRFIIVFQDWAGCIIWWTVQGKVTIQSSTAGWYYPSHITVAPLCPLRLFKETPGLHDDIIYCTGRCHDVDISCTWSSKSWSVFDSITSFTVSNFDLYYSATVLLATCERTLPLWPGSVFSFHHPCIQTPMGPLFCFWCNSCSTFSLGCFPTFKAVSRVTKIEQITASRCSHPRKCNILSLVRILVSPSNRIWQ